MKPTIGPDSVLHSGSNVLAVLGHVAVEGTRWAIGPTSFADPVDVLTTTDIEDVESCIRGAESAAAAGRWVVGYISYDAAPGLNPRLRVPGDESTIPLVWFGVFESSAKRENSHRLSGTGEWRASMSREEHADAVASIRRSIEAGDTYQANLTFAMDAPLEGRPVDLFRKMVRAQLESYSAFLDLGEAQIVSISPELFIKGTRGTVVTRPMKGTAPRGRSSSEDSQRLADLMSSEKERAGNIMIVDMLRNDLGRVSRAGSVRATELFEPERHPTVWQLTSTVEAELTDEVGLCELLRATFPSGSVTGAPKVSTMGIIADLESVPRGVYCGAIGYIVPGGDEFEFSVAIRTGVVSEGRFRYHVGGGITHDSLAGSEYEECLWKALVVTSENEVPSLLETMLYEPGTGVELLEGHLQRLADSAAFWGIPLDLVAVGDALSAVEGHRPQRVRLTLDQAGEVEVEIDDVEMGSDPVELSVADQRIDPSDPLWYHKTVDRDRYPNPDVGEVVLVNIAGEVSETNISNLMVNFDGEWVTPPIESGCLPGVFRQNLLSSGRVVERVVTLEHLLAADELAVTNAVRGWRKAVLVDS